MTKKTVDDDFTENIIDVDVSREMENSFLEYAYSVIYSAPCLTPGTASSPYSAASFTPWETWEFALTVPM